MNLRIIYLDIPNLNSVSLPRSFEKVKKKTISSSFYIIEYIL